MTLLGLGNSPVTKGILISTFVVSSVFHLRNRADTFNVSLDFQGVVAGGQLWRLITCHTVCSSMGTLVATSICLYRMRRLEPLLGSRKFGAFAVVTHLMSLPLEAAAVVNSGTLKLTSGPLPFVFALLVLYYAVVPPTKPRFFGALGMDFSDKSLTYCVAGMLAFCDGWKSFVPAVCGAIVGSLYVMDTMSVQAVRLPDMVYRCFWKVFRPLLRPPRRPSPVARLSAARRPRPTPNPNQPQGNGAGAGAGAGSGSGSGFLSFLARPHEGSTRLRIPQLPQPQPQPPPLPPPSEESVATLTGMGFERGAVLSALQHCGNNTSAAANWLLSGTFTRGTGDAGSGSAGSGSGSGTGTGTGTAGLGPSSSRSSPVPGGGIFGVSAPGSQHDHDN